MNGVKGIERLDTIRVRTPECAVFSHRLASPVPRMLALLADWMIVSAGWGIVSVAISLLAIVSVDAMRAVSVIGYFVVSQGYSIFFEWRWRGLTPGKRMLRLRVIDERGLRLSLWQVVLRNLLRAIDALPLGYFAGGATALLSRRCQRLGDLAAGTLVIWEASEPAPDPALLGSEKYNTLRGHAPVVARLRQAVSPEEARVAWLALARRDKLDDAARAELFADLAEHFKSLTAFPESVTDGVSNEQFVRNVVDVLFVERHLSTEAR
ncbi:putative RDD family membrane protein YckC [Ereboglobus sp. PH5-5]|uniref:RDD family protein n=1 Tax=Ereboglobus sp. PH5-5 TaxID=2940529 RepID=UPI0024057C0C|nr:RDD family protein [Ereboglobus sp. PH5-5]MDF9833511.1 putative RDD family membrane protein YckC [Ereboglobus sp. PH5-5]